MEAVSISLLILTIYGFTLFAYAVVKHNELKTVRITYTNLIILYIIILVTFSFLPINLPQQKGFNYIPVAKFFTSDSSQLFTYIAYGIFAVVLFLPLGFLMGMYCKLKALNHEVLYSVMLGLLVSLIIEVAQLYLPFNRICDVDEIVFNVIGSFIGSAIFYILSTKPKFKHILRSILYH